MATTAPTAERQHGHGIDLSDLDLDGVPGTHRHAIRALRQRLNELYDGIHIRRVYHGGTNTSVYLSFADDESEVFTTFDIMQALDDTAVETAAFRTGIYTSIVLDYSLGFEV